MFDYDKLERALVDADKEAQKFSSEIDNGTSNFDTPIIKLEGVQKEKLAELEIELIKISGGFWKGWYRVMANLSGQGYRRTKMAEVVAEKLCAAGYDATVYYLMD